MLKKAGDHKKTEHNSTITNKNDVVLNEVVARQVLQTFRSDLAIHTFAKKYQRVRQAFKTNLVDQNCSMMFLNAGSYVQRVLGGNANDNPIGNAR